MRTLFMENCLAYSPRIDQLYEKDPISLKFAILYGNRLSVNGDVYYVYLTNDEYDNKYYKLTLDISEAQENAVIFYSVDSKGTVYKYTR